MSVVQYFASHTDRDQGLGEHVCTGRERCRSRDPRLIVVRFAKLTEVHPLGSSSLHPSTIES